MFAPARADTRYPRGKWARWIASEVPARVRKTPHRHCGLCAGRGDARSDGLISRLNGTGP